MVGEAWHARSQVLGASAAFLYNTTCREHLHEYINGCRGGNVVSIAYRGSVVPHDLALNLGWRRSSHAADSALYQPLHTSYK